MQRLANCKKEREEEKKKGDAGLEKSNRVVGVVCVYVCVCALRLHHLVLICEEKKLTSSRYDK